MKVKEKEFLGYFDYQGEFLYFDEDGTAALKTTEVIPGRRLSRDWSLIPKSENEQKTPGHRSGYF